MNPYVFVVGCPRSGTTVLQRIGDAHPELAIVHGLKWLWRWRQPRLGLTREGMVTREFVAMLRTDSHFARLELDPAVLDTLVEDGRPKHYARFVTELFDLHGRARGKRLVGEKTPHHVRHIAALHSLWPNAKFVHLIRDGRDVALSLPEWSRAERSVGRFPTWTEDPVTTTALFWEWNVRLGRDACDLLGPDRYHELRYEALVAAPEPECRKLCDFLGLAYDPAMLRFHEGRTRSTDGLSANDAWLPVTRGLRSWRTQMAPTDVRRFEAAAGALLDELGYPRAVASFSGAELERAGRLRDTFADHARSRRLAVSEAWGSLAP